MSDVINYTDHETLNQAWENVTKNPKENVYAEYAFDAFYTGLNKHPNMAFQ